MADYTPPLGGGDDGGDELLRNVRKARQKAQAKVEATEAATADIAALNKRLSGAQRKLLDELDAGLAAATGPQRRTAKVLAEQGLIQRTDASRDRYQVTDLGRQVANIERQAERAATQVQDAVRRGVQRAAARAPKLAPNTDPQMQRVMQEYIDAVQAGLDERAKTLREQLAAADVVTKKPPLIGQARPASRPSRALVNNVPAVGSPQWMSGMRKALQSPNFTLTPYSRFPEEIAGQLGLNVQRPAPRVTVNPALPKNDPVRKQIEQADAEATRQVTQAKREEAAARRHIVRDALHGQSLDLIGPGDRRRRERYEVLDPAGQVIDVFASKRAAQGTAADLNRELKAETRATRQVTQAKVEEAAARREAMRVYHGTSVPFEGLPARRPGAIGTFVSTNRAEAETYYRGGEYGRRRTIPMEFSPRRILDAAGFAEDYDAITRELGDLGKKSGLGRSWRAAIDEGRAEEFRAAAIARGYDAIKVSADNYIALSDDVLRAAQRIQAVQQYDQPIGPPPPPPRKPPAPPTPPEPERDPMAARVVRDRETAQRELNAAEQKLTALTEGGASNRTKAVRGLRKEIAALQAELTPAQDFTAPLGGNADEFERIIGSRKDLLAREIAAADAFDQAVREGKAPAPGTPQFVRQVEEQRALAARGNGYSPGTGIVPHPFLFGDRIPGPFGREQFVPRQPVSDSSVAPGPRGMQERADFLLAQAEQQKALVDEERKQLLRRAGRGEDVAGLLAENAARRRATVDVVKGLQGEAKAIPERIESLRAANARHVAAAQAAATAEEQALREGRRLPAVRRVALDRLTETLNASNVLPPRQPWGRYMPPRDVWEGTATEVPYAPAGGWGGGGPPPPPPPPPGGPPPPPPPPPFNPYQYAKEQREERARQEAQDLGYDERQTKQHINNAHYLGRAALDEADSQATLNERMRTHATILGSTDMAMRRHGALTTEFIEAAARGEASTREWGYQLGATAAKFAGWTAVSIPIFAALDGIRQLGKGAIDSASGVNVLQRSINNVEPQRAQAAFRQLSREFNLPIDQVVDAFYRSGQVFHNFDDALRATRVSLSAVRVGDMDTATATKNLNAVIQGAALGPERLTQVFDEVNAAQNRFSVAINGTTSGLARASGAWRNAGGSVEYLLSLLVLGQRVTGRTGENIGTMLQRSVGFIQRPKNQQQLRTFGIDTTRNVQQIYEQAFQVAQGLHGEQLQQLATALSSPQYASYLVPVLKNRDLFREIQTGTDPNVDYNKGGARGAAQIELNKVLGQLNEQIARIGTNLQQLGSNLAQSGFLNSVALVLKGFNELLGTVNSLLNIFNELPKPIRQLLSTWLTLRAVAGGMRRFNVGAGLQDHPVLRRAAPFLIESDDRRANRLGGAALRKSVNVAQDENTRAQRNAYVSAANYKAAANARDLEFARVEQRLAAGEINAVQATAMQVREQRKVVAARELSNRDTERARGQLRILASTEDDMAGYNEARAKATRRGADAAGRAELTRMGQRIPPVLGNLTLSQHARDAIRAGEDPLIFANAPLPGPQARRLPNAGQVVGAAARGTRDAVRAMRLHAALYRSAVTSFGVTNASMMAASSAAGRIGAMRVPAIGLAGGLAAGARTMGRFAVGILAAVPQILAFMAAMMAVEQAIAYVSRQRSRLDQQRRDARGVDAQGKALTFGTRQDLQNYRQRLQRQSETSTNPGSLRNIANTFGELFSGNTDVLWHGGGWTQEQANAQTNRQQRMLDARDSAIRNAARTGAPQPGLTREDLQDRINRDFQRFHDGQITLKQLRDLQAKRFREIELGLITGDQRNDLYAQYQRRLVNNASKGRRGFAATLLQGGIEGVTDEQLSNLTEGLGALVDANLATPGQRQNYLVTQLVAAAQSRGKTSPFDAKKYAGAVGNIEKTLGELGKDELDRALAVATTQEQRDAAYDKYLANLRGEGRLVKRAAIRQLRRQRAELERQASEAEAQLATMGGSGLLSQQRGFSIVNKPAITALNRLSVFGEVAPFLADLTPSIADPNAATPEQQDTKIKAMRDAAKAKTRAIRRIQKSLSDALAQISNELDQANKEADAQRAIQEHADLITARAEYNAAGEASTPSGQIAGMRDRLAGQQELLAYMQRNQKAGGWSDADILRQKTTIRETNRQLADAYKALADQQLQDARDLINARADYRSSLTDNPVRQARIAANAADAIVRRGGFKNPAERLRAQADRNNRSRAAEQAVYDRRIENVDYEHDIGKLGDDAYIAALQRIERTMKQGSEARRQMKMKIGRLKHDLMNESDLAIDISGLKLPTAYEVRRAVRGAVKGMAVTNNYATTVNVSRDVDVAKVGSTLDRYHRGSGKSLARAAGDR